MFSSIKKSEKAIESAVTMHLARTLTLEEPYCKPEIPDPHLRLGQLVSRKTLNSKTTVDGHRIEAQITIESIGSNGVKHISNGLVSRSRTERSRQTTITVNTQMFASVRDTIPAFIDLRTILFSHMELSPKLHEFSTTVVDKEGVHRFPSSQLEIL